MSFSWATAAGTATSTVKLGLSPSSLNLQFTGDAVQYYAVCVGVAPTFQYICALNFPSPHSLSRVARITYSLQAVVPWFYVSDCCGLGLLVCLVGPRTSVIVLIRIFLSVHWCPLHSP